MTVLKFRKRKRKWLPLLCSRSRATTGKECTKKCDARAKLFSSLSNLFLFLPFSLPSPSSLGSFSNDDGDGNEIVKKRIGLDWQNNNFARASLFYTFLCRHCTTTTWKCLSFIFLWRTLPSDDELFFLFLNLQTVSKKTTSRKFSYIWHFQRTGINATKFEKGANLF